MYICICNAVSERQVEQSVKDGVRSVEELSMTLGVGAGCGRCLDCAGQLLREACNGLCSKKSVSPAG